MPHAAKTINTKRTVLKQMTLADARQLHLTVGVPDVMKFWVGGADRTIEETERRIAVIVAHWNTYNFGDWGVVHKESLELIGFAGLHHLEDMQEVNLGYALKESVWRCGYATEICRAVLEYGFANLELPVIVAVIWPENVASITLAQKLGMGFERKMTWAGGPRVVYSVTRDKWRTKSR